MMLRMRRLWLVLLVVALGAGAYELLGGSGRGDAEARYETTVVDRGPITATITATGTVNPVSSVQVGTYVSGPIQAIYADFNTPVRRGQLLAKIDPRPFQVKVDASRADLANARAKRVKDRADAALKATTLRRQRELAGHGIVAQSDLDVADSQEAQARAQLALDEADIRSAEAKLQEAEVNLAYTDILAPVDGVVVARNVDSGQTVAATFQTPTLFLVAEDLTKMLVSTSVSESDIGAVASGQDASFTVDAYPAATFRGRVSQVRNAPVTVQNVVTYDVIIGVDNGDLRLKPGMTANVTIATASRADALRIPTSALRFRPPAEAGAAAADGGPRVWVLAAGGELHAATVTTSIADERFTEVTSGLGEGDRVVTALRRDAAVPRPATGPSFAPARRMR
jgi:HlyD family secretion protein